MSKRSLKLPSLAKINWFLRVFGKRDDDYHEISTAFQTISLCDFITFDIDDQLSLTCDDPALPTDDRNLIMKAANALASAFDVRERAAIHLEKRIPSPGGLGGGSSNAAITLLGLSCLWDLRVTFDQLEEIGSRIGADVPFFLTGGTALGQGRGTRISTSVEIEEKLMVILTPNTHVSTEEAYLNLGLGRLTKKDAKSILHICYEDAERLESQRLELINDFENAVFQMKPEIRRLKEKLLDQGAKGALMSGSGASVFAVFDNEKDRQAALDSFGLEDEVKKFSVETISRREYSKMLKPCEHLLRENF